MTRIIAGAFLVLAACSHAEPRVEMLDGRVFEPGNLTVAAGERVTWTNPSDELHTVTADAQGDDYFGSGGFDSAEQARKNLTEALIPSGGEYSYTFTTPGVYTYYCIPHEDQQMKGRITVET